jgi:hypothetical protein
MATIFTEPGNDKINYTQWAQLIQKTTFEAGGFIALGLTNMTGTGASQIALGSRVEIGGSLYISTANETISGSPSSDITTYIYAVPSGNAASFTYSSTTPTWNAVKGGWYNGNNRAVAKFFYSGGQYLSKTILDSYGAFSALDTNVPIPTTGGTVVASISGVKRTASYTLAAGGYRYSLTSGAGGGDASGQTGGVASKRETNTGTFYWRGGTINVKTGGDGFNGGKGSSQFGGGSGAGEESEIIGVDKTNRVKAGKSGNGNEEGIGGDGGAGGGDFGSYPGDNGDGGGYGFGGGGNGSDGGAGGGGAGGKGGLAGGVYRPKSGGDSNYGANGGDGKAEGGGAGGAPGWQRPEGGPGGSCTIWRVL